MGSGMTSTSGMVELGCSRGITTSVPEAAGNWGITDVLFYFLWAGRREDEICQVYWLDDGFR